MSKASNKAGILEVKIPTETKQIIVESTDEHFEPFRKKYVPSIGEMKNEVILLGKIKEEEIPVEETKKEITIRPIYFDYASSKIPMREMSHVWNIVRLLRSNPTLCLKITGHTDSTGSESANTRLGMKRAAELKRVLMNFGLSRFRYKLASKGESQPSDEYLLTGQHRFNRRVEFEVIHCENVDDDENFP
jgi:outer membrane protein OmpA-like peptidoglycan-associated protein